MFKIQIDQYIHLELIHFCHIEELLLLSTKNKEHLKRWMLWDDDKQNSEELKKVTESILADYSQGELVSTFIFYKNTMVGQVGLFDIKGKLLKKAEISYWLDECHQGKGIIQKAVKKIVELGFEYYALDKITIRCDIENHRSSKIPIKLGFQHDGLLRHDMVINGEKRDFNLYVLLKEDWRQGHVSVE